MRVANSIRTAIRWSAAAAGICAALYFLNSAAFSAWMAGGPPNPYPAGWNLRSQTQFLYSLAALCGCIAVFRAVPRFPRVGRLTWFIGLVSLLFALAPSLILFERIDTCLDQGGRWNYTGNQCEH